MLFMMVILAPSNPQTYNRQVFLFISSFIVAAAQRLPRRGCPTSILSTSGYVWRNAAAGRVDGARVLTALDSVINAFNDLLATKCGS